MPNSIVGAALLPAVICANASRAPIIELGQHHHLPERAKKKKKSYALRRDSSRRPLKTICRIQALKSELGYETVPATLNQGENKFTRSFAGFGISIGIRIRIRVGMTFSLRILNQLKLKTKDKFSLQEFVAFVASWPHMQHSDNNAVALG